MRWREEEYASRSSMIYNKVATDKERGEEGVGNQGLYVNAPLINGRKVDISLRKSGSLGGLRSSLNH